jgi:enoyl-CoA hydratase/carnithine racemase
VAVTTELDGSVAVVTMRWPEKRNSLSAPDGAELGEAITAAGARDDVTGIVLTGEGAFCSGGDLRYFSQVSRELSVEEIRSTVYGTMQGVVRALAGVPVPTAAAVDGPAIGLGLDLALACDMRFVGPEGYLRQGWARAGLVPGVGGVALLHRVAPGLLWQLVATQERLGPERAAELGLAELGAPDAVSAATERLTTLSALGRDLLGYHVALARLASWPAQENFDRAADIQAGLIGSQRFRDLVDRALGATDGRP